MVDFKYYNLVHERWRCILALKIYPPNKCFSLTSEALPCSGYFAIFTVFLPRQRASVSRKNTTLRRTRRTLAYEQDIKQEE